MFCCPNCFCDDFLKSRISAMSNKKGLCSLCKAENVTLISPKELTDLFDPLFEIYKEDVNGHPINELIQNDWAIFSSPKQHLQKKLLNNISQNPNLSKMKFVPKFLKDKINIEKWHSFTQELKYTNRFLPKEAPESALFEQFGQLLGVIIEKGTRFYRARINNDGISFKVKDLKKPPADLAQNGRANPLGIPYLYVSSTAETAIAEVRGNKGETITLLEFNARYRLDLIDLRDPKNTISPFELSDEIEFIYKHMPYLSLLGDELSKPISPRKANLEYLSTQYLCEMIKQIPYHGIIYKSSISDGNNYVIFNDNRLKANKLSQHRITEMRIKSELLK